MKGSPFSLWLWGPWVPILTESQKFNDTGGSMKAIPIRAFPAMAICIAVNLTTASLFMLALPTSRCACTACNSVNKDRTCFNLKTWWIPYTSSSTDAELIILPAPSENYGCAVCT